MAMRKEGVHLSLQDDFSSGMARVAATTALANRELRDLDGTSSRTAPSLTRLANEANGVGPAMDRTGSSTRRASADINQYSGRLSLLVQGLTAVAPATIPITAVALPAIGGLTTAVGAAALAVGTGMLAFRGMGDALGALNDARLDPTVANLDKAREAMDQLSPAAQDFATHLMGLQPVLEKLQSSAASEMFPGLTAGLDDALVVLPQVRGLLKAMGGAVGDLGEITGESLASGKWNEFLGFLTDEAPPALEALGQTLGSTAHGFSELLMAMEPLNGDALDWIRDTAGDFDSWASGLSSTEGFRGFVDYIRETGPQVEDFVGSLASAGVQIVQAFAPLGGPTLEILTRLADLIGTIADSPIGTPLAAIATAASALSLLNKGITASQGLMAGGIFGGAAAGGGEGDAAGGIGSFFQDNADEVRAAAGEMREAFTGVGNTLRQSLGRGLAPTSGQLMTLNTRMRTVASSAGRMAMAAGKTAAPMAGMALAATDVDDKLGISNTAMLGLMGTMAGPWGTAIGVGVGGLLDLKAAGDDATSALKGLDNVAASGDLTDFSDRIAKAKKEWKDLQDVDYTSPGDILGDLGARASMNLGGGPEKLEKTKNEAEALQASLESLRDSIGGGGSLEAVAASAAPAMNALGISLTDLQDASPTMLPALIDQITGYQNTAASAAGRTAALANAFSGMSNEMLPVEERAKAVKTALDALLSPQLNLANATDAWRDGLRNITDDLDKTNRSLVENNDASSMNREAIRTQVTNLQSLVDAQADTGASGATMARTLREGGKAILDAGAAAGLSRPQIRDYLRTLGLTPKAIKTVMQAETSKAINNVNDLKAATDSLHDKTINVAALTGPARAALQSIEAFRIHDKSFTVTQHTNATLGEAKVKKAGGGQVFGPGTSTSDSIPALLSNREFVMPVTAVDHYGLSFMERVRARRLADGGPADPADESTADDDEATGKKKLTAKQAAAARKKAAARARARAKARNAYGDLDVDTSIHADGLSDAFDRFTDDVDRVRGLYKDAGLHLSKAQKDQIDDLRKASRELDGFTKTLQDTKNAQAAYQAQVAGSIDHDLFGTGNGLAGAQAAADADANDANAMLAAITSAVNQGLVTTDNPLTAAVENAVFTALSTSGDVTSAQQLAAGGPGAIAALQASVGNKQNAQQALAGYAGQQVYGAEVTKQTAEVMKQTQAINRMEKAINKMGDRVHDGARDGTRQGAAEGGNQHAAAAGQRSGQRSKNNRRGGRRAA